jgi:hypothetical protein
LQANVINLGSLRHIQINLKDSGYAAKHPVIAHQTYQFDELSIAKMLSRKIKNSVRCGGPTHPLGTPELYLTDPDNITLQIQDVKYCGGRVRSAKYARNL